MDKLNNEMEKVDYWIQLAVDAVETAVSRINDMINELDTAIDDYQATPPRITDDELNGVTQSIRNAFNKLKDNIEKLFNKIRSYIESASPVVTQDEMNLYMTTVREYASALASLANILNNKYIELLNNLVNFINKMATYIWAYRTYNPQATVAPPQPPIEVGTVAPSYKVTVRVVEE